MSATEAAASLRELFASANPSLDRLAGCVAGLARPPGRVATIVEGVVRGLDDLAVDAPASGDGSELVDYVFGALEFTGNQANYFDPQNSYLDRVIERRLGIPITLAVVAAEVGRRVGTTLRLIGFPGHFLLGDGDDLALFFDPFAGGRRLRIDECAQMLTDMFPGAVLEPAHTAALRPHQVTGRMLNNLKQIHLSSGDLGSAADVALVGLALPDPELAVRLEAIKLLEAVGRHDQAAEVLDTIAEIDTANAERHRKAATLLRFNRN